VSIFAPLPLPVVEQLARDARALRFEPAQRIVTEGEVGEDFYVIVRGEVEVRPTGEPARVLHAGESFGEIALLREIPRTATVTARTPVEVLAIGRDPFITAVTGHPESAAAAHAVAAARLGSLRPDIASV
jgi:CRP-like cAMP-binding protein